MSDEDLRKEFATGQALLDAADRIYRASEDEAGASSYLMLQAAYQLLRGSFEASTRRFEEILLQDGEEKEDES